MSIYTLGIDIGSTASKCIMLADGKDIVAKSLIPVGAGTSGPQRAISQVLENAGKAREEMSYILATGYGRNSLEEFADQQMSELSCHAKGASFLFPEVRTVIDIGGQDVKVLQIENGVMTNFVMNDKCAAGTGRFLDVMARVLEVKVEDLGTLGAQSTKNVGISSTCTVFAESEVISQLSQDTDKRDIINGIHHSVASRVAGLAHRVGVRDQVVMTGGVAQNTGVVKALEEELDRVTREWLGQKKSDLLRFTMGTVGLDDPMDKRYFYAKNDQGKVVAFIVFVPFLGKNGYMADVTRHGNDAPGGVMETIIYEAFQAFKAEGVEYGSLGVAPLAGLDRESRNPVERLLDFVYDHLNDCYGFRDLFRAKEKYSPTEWVPSYYAYLPKLPSPSMLYAVVEIQNPKGIRGYVKSMVTGEARRIAAALAREKEKRP